MSYSLTSIVPTAAPFGPPVRASVEGVFFRMGVIPGCDANATGAARHAQLVAALSSHSAPTSGRDVLVLNTIDRHYTTLIASWARMVEAAPFAKQLFVVAMDGDAAAATRAANVPHFSPSADDERDVCMQQQQQQQQHLLPHAPGGAGRHRGGVGDSQHQAPQPGSYKKVKIYGKEADTRILPPDLPSWKMRSVLAGLSLGWRVLFSESDVLWMPGARMAELISPSASDKPFDFAPQRHPMTPVYNFGFFFAQGPTATSFFSCVVGEWERRQLEARLSGRPVEIASDQRFLYDTARRTRHTPDCGHLRVKRLAYHRYPTCRGWIGLRQPELMDVVHVTYCHRLSMLLSSEDVCKRRMMELWYLRGGVSLKNLTSKAWNVEQGC